MPFDRTGPWTKEEDERLKGLVGNARSVNSVKWSVVASSMTGRNSKQ